MFFKRVKVLTSDLKKRLLGDHEILRLRTAAPVAPTDSADDDDEDNDMVEEVKEEEEEQDQRVSYHIPIIMIIFLFTRLVANIYLDISQLFF
jgi:hypothetical protein